MVVTDDDDAFGLARVRSRGADFSSGPRKHFFPGFRVAIS